MASGSRQGSGEGGDEPTGATEPITLTDPDGAVTRVAPWSSWTREQVRAPGGEPALVTRLDQGQLWFSAGRRRSPWRHEVHVGPAIVSTPRGRFQAVAEADGGATISCLAGRTRVVAGLREPVLLGPDQSAAVSSDGRTLVVMDRALVDTEGETTIDLTDDADAELEEAPAVMATVGAAEAGTGSPLRSNAGGSAGPGGTDGESTELVRVEEESSGPRRARLGWIPELVAIAALLLVLVAAVWVFTSRDDDNDASTIVTDPPVTTALPPPTVVTTTTETEAVLIPPVTEDATTTEQITTTSPPSAAGASASGELTACRRADGGVAATVVVTHRGGPASRFEVEATLVDDAGVVFATGSATSDLLDPGGVADVEVLIPVDGSPQGACELGPVTAA